MVSLIKKFTKKKFTSLWAHIYRSLYKYTEKNLKGICQLTIAVFEKETQTRIIGTWRTRIIKFYLLTNKKRH